MQAIFVDPFDTSAVTRYLPSSKNDGPMLSM